MTLPPGAAAARSRLSRRAANIVTSCALVVLVPAAARGATTYTIAGTGAYQYTSNVFDLAPGAPIPGTSDLHRSDSFAVYTANFDVDHTWQLQEWRLRATATEERYDHFTQLSHNEYLLDGSWKWRLGVRTDGLLEVLRQRIMVPFTQLEQLQTQLATSTIQREAAKLGYQLLQHWKVEASGYTSTTLEPLSDAPDLRLLESQIGATLRYLDTATLSWGASAFYTHGDYTHANGTLNPSYDQKSVALIAAYSPVSGSSLNASIGYTDRESAVSIDSISGLIGHLALTRQLTGKTSVDLAIDRNVASYLTNAGSETDTSARVGISWHATYRIAVNASYTWTYSDFPDQGSVPGSARIDHLQYSSLTINYQPLDWLTLRPFANVQLRSSNNPVDHFNATTYGIQLTAQSPKY